MLRMSPTSRRSSEIQEVTRALTGCTCSMPNLKRSTVWRGLGSFSTYFSFRECFSARHALSIYNRATKAVEEKVTHSLALCEAVQP